MATPQLTSAARRQRSQIYARISVQMQQRHKVRIDVAQQGPAREPSPPNCTLDREGGNRLEVREFHDGKATHGYDDSAHVRVEVTKYGQIDSWQIEIDMS
jgi:hypothetical protein